MNEKLLGIGLPKWPQMRVVGENLTKEQAWEIIRRTDTFILHGYKFASNDRAGDLKMAKAMGMPIEPDDGGDLKGMEYYDKLEQWKKDWGIIEPVYVHNSWLSSAFIGGPHGWCSPEGRIYYGDNVGKWPDVEDILNDWKLLTKEFPFLKLDVVLYNGESCEDNIVPLVRINVKNNSVKLLDPNVDGLGMVESWEQLGAGIIHGVLSVAMVPSSQREHHSKATEMIDSWIKKFRNGKYGTPKCQPMKSIKMLAEPKGKGIDGNIN